MCLPFARDGKRNGPESDDRRITCVRVYLISNTCFSQTEIYFSVWICCLELFLAKMDHTLSIAFALDECRAGVERINNGPAATMHRFYFDYFGIAEKNVGWPHKVQIVCCLLLKLNRKLFINAT